jgi:hypothetical protein
MAHIGHAENCRNPRCRGKCVSSPASDGYPLSRYIEAWRAASIVSINLRSDPDFGTDEWKIRRDRICGEAIKNYIEG